jgi:hypothetical protein
VYPFLLFFFQKTMENAPSPMAIRLLLAVLVRFVALTPAALSLRYRALICLQTSRITRDHRRACAVASLDVQAKQSNLFAGLRAHYVPRYAFPARGTSAVLDEAVWASMWLRSTLVAFGFDVRVYDAHRRERGGCMQ